MKDKEKQNPQKKIQKPSLVHFSWGGYTHEWEEEADQLMNYKQDQLDKKESREEKERKIEYGNEQQYWLDKD
ncbi:hypothetical protein [Maledivibacter halophilus]|uniref:Uncharacterized protein n=1 Tax=Maledivibacter halophilus TaxID=36842 RepID=A0A1T5LU42_9FIRM|nr:hypothetical protein [Maledivibacter halophilus]SKC79466.1 hypothetical protein SAMN02194393_03310 [Maledivibacter halophilus]